MKRAIGLAVVVFFIAMAPGLVHAEWFGDVYVGVASTQDDDVTISLLGLSATGPVEFDESFVIGGRAGYWFSNTSPFGVALDLSFFQPDDEIDVIPLSALFMFRWSFGSEQDISKAQFQPYVGIGPGLFFSEIESDLRPVFNDTFDDNQVDIGVDFRAGFVWKISAQIGIFAEYRFTRFSPEFKDSILGISTTASVDLNTHHINVGIRF